MAEEPVQTNSYDKSSLNAVNRKKQRGVYDYKTIHTLIDTTPVLHVAFNPPPSRHRSSTQNPKNENDDEEQSFPAILPMLGCTSPLTTTYPDPSSKEAAEDPPTEADDALNQRRCIYLHGYVSSRLMRLPEASGAAAGKGGGDGGDGAGVAEEDREGAEKGRVKGVPVTVSATSLDGIVLALTPFAHSCNYRSVVVYGHAIPVHSPSEKLHAMRLITNNLIPHRWSHTRVPPTSAELLSTGILRVDIHSASAKIHVGGPSDDKKELRNEEVVKRVWTGVVPTWLEFGEPREGTENEVGGVPEYLGKWVEGERRRAREGVEGSLRDEKGGLGVKERDGTRGGDGGGLGQKVLRGWFGL